MTQSNRYLEALKKAQQNPPAELPGMGELRKFCGAIADYIGGFVECSPVPGEPLFTYGQEYKVILTFTPSGYSQTLVRAYLNAGGAPYLDVYDKKGPQECKDVENLARRLEEYLTVPTVLATLDTFREWAEARRRGA